MLTVKREIRGLGISWKGNDFSHWDRFFSRKETVPVEKETIISQKETVPVEKETIISRKETVPMKKETVLLQKILTTTTKI